MSDVLLPALAPGADLDGSVTVAGESVTFRDLGSWSRRCAANLRAAGVRRLAVLAEPTLETVVAVVGSLAAGVPVVPVPKDAGAHELAYMIGDSGVDAWVGPERSEAGGLLVLAPRDLLGTESDDDLPEPGGDEIAMILYTSGTTGAPKGVLLSRSAIAAGIDALAEAWGWTAADTLAHGLPLFHVHGLVVGCLGPLRVGSSLVHTGRPSPQAYADAAATMYFGVPTIWHRIAEDEESARRLGGARVLISGSAPLPVPVFERMRELTGQEMVERYGMTETLLTVANRIDRPRLPGHVGWPVAGVETRLRDEHGAVVPRDGQSVGRLEVRGPTLFSGYLGMPEETAKAYTPDGWFHTGDVATIDADGNHRIVGRESVDLIKSGGYRIGAGEIEAFLLGFPGVREVAVVGAPDEDLGQRIVAFVVPDEGRRPDPEELSQAVADELSVHKRPRDVVFVDSLPRNEMGKVQKKKLLG
ncbi:acyl-CoA synthetase [Ammonicoccus fulvus]|uniref:Acyl-CoA synthetase n=1 Tax=Ammonicoccus fulvus TaxID=3138240 RepID=A0ABZ3FSH5_9ACTN